MGNCHARQHSDEMHCAPCGLRWDVNDPEPPPCRLNGIARVVRGAVDDPPGHLPVLGPDERVARDPVAAPDW